MWENVIDSEAYYNSPLNVWLLPNGTNAGL